MVRGWRLRRRQGGIDMRLYAGRVVEILSEHTTKDGTRLVLVGWYDAADGHVTQWVRADEVAQ